MHSSNYKLYLSAYGIFNGGDFFGVESCSELGINEFLEIKNTILIDIEYIILKIIL